MGLAMITEVRLLGGQILRDHEMGAGRLIRVFAGRSYPAAVTTNRGVPGDSPVGCAFGVRTPCGPVPGPRGSGARPLGLALLGGATARLAEGQRACFATPPSRSQLRRGC